MLTYLLLVCDLVISPLLIDSLNSAVKHKALSVTSHSRWFSSISQGPAARETGKVWSYFGYESRVCVSLAPRPPHRLRVINRAVLR